MQSSRLSSERELKHAVELVGAACRMPERWFLGDDGALNAIALDGPSQQAHGDIELLQTQHSGMDSQDDEGFCEKVAIPDDACSVDGPPTPDNEEGNRAGMPAIQRLTEAASPGTVAAAMRALHLL